MLKAPIERKKFKLPKLPLPARLHLLLYALGSLGKLLKPEGSSAQKAPSRPYIRSGGAAKDPLPVVSPSSFRGRRYRRTDKRDLVLTVHVCLEEI